MQHPHLDISEDVQQALMEKLPIVSLESTIIAHGMPYPQNVETALEVEKIVWETGAVPATIAVIKGRLRAGLSVDEIDALGRSGQQVQKLSRRDLSYAISQKKDGATTVATTMIISHLAGIPVFATGGIGGVHRGAQQNFDISADLQELAQTPVAVVCAGAKSILDIGLTLEYLETLGVPVVGYQTHEFPAFYCRKSGFEVSHCLRSTDEIAAMMQAQWQLGMRGGMVIANPIPEIHGLDEKEMETIINQALKDAEHKNIKGKELTPFLLAHIKELTHGKSLKANIQLVYNNVLVASQLAIAYATLSQ